MNFRVVEKCIYGFLKHSCFVFDDYIRCTKIHKFFQTDISVENPSVKIIEVACSKSAAAFKRNKRSQIRRKNRKDCENHVFRSFSRTDELIENIDSFLQLCLLVLITAVCKFLFDFLLYGNKIHLFEELSQRSSTRFSIDLVGTVSFKKFVVLFFFKILSFDNTFYLGSENDISFAVDNTAQVRVAHSKKSVDIKRRCFDIPDVSYRSSQSNMSHSLSSDLGFDNFDTAFFTYDTFVFHPSVFTAETLVIVDRTENFCAEKAVSFRFVRSVIECFRFFDLAVRPFEDFFRRSERYLDSLKIKTAFRLVEFVDIFQGILLSVVAVFN